MDKPFRTIVDVKPYGWEIDYTTPTLLIGSCFTDNIGQILKRVKFSVEINPFGVVYNPISVGMVLKRIIDGNPFKENELNFHNKLWLSYLHHTTFSRIDKAECIENINNELIKANKFWAKTQRLVITFGTARVYYNKKGEPVANCHKIPAKEFTNRLLTADEIVLHWKNLLDKIVVHNPSIKVMFTVSPVRHWKDGAFGNQLSKATLFIAVNQLLELFPNNAYYFPAYEIMMDDLRDYRFYNDDMLHPSPFAVDYIWQKFRTSVVSPKAASLCNEIEKVLLALNHKPFNTKTEQYRAFILSTIEKIDEICKQSKSINFDVERKSLNELLV
jgi:hypothetical protein